MSIDYKGHHATTGYLTHVTNTIDNKKYTISTVARGGACETAVFKRTPFGALSPLMRVWAQDETRHLGSTIKWKNSLNSASLRTGRMPRRN
jgi:hypothetical protein